MGVEKVLLEKYGAGAAVQLVEDWNGAGPLDAPLSGVIESAEPVRREPGNGGYTRIVFVRWNGRDCTAVYPLRAWHDLDRLRLSGE